MKSIYELDELMSEDPRNLPDGFEACEKDEAMLSYDAVGSGPTFYRHTSGVGFYYWPDYTFEEGYAVWVREKQGEEV